MRLIETVNSCSDREDEDSDVISFEKGPYKTSSVQENQAPILMEGSMNNGRATPTISRQFWKAGEYDVGLASKAGVLSWKTHLRVHPKFLHSNATSHKWAFGAIAELLDNAVDEIQNGGTFVIIDKVLNPRNGSGALLIQDDGGGMDPEALRRCMSFGFSEKSSKSSIGQYGNGFKTSSMRLGADAIIFTRCIGERVSTQSVGLLSYTFLTLTGQDDIVVPMVDYEFNTSTGELRSLLRPSEEYFSSNLFTLLQWSPYASEAELLKQFDDIGHRGTKVILYNLWLNDEGDLELDFESDAEDILISGAPEIGVSKNPNKMMLQHHYAIRFRYSLRVYSAILYLRLPATFRVILRGQVVEHHAIVNDLKYHEFILYKPHVAGKEVHVITTIGFIREAPLLNIHGFNVYHKNRLILPFWKVLHYDRSKGRGVVGVLEASFIEPTHNKQDFEKTALYNKLEARLKDMTAEYWDYHCGFLGYAQVKRPVSAYASSHETLQPSVKPNSSTSMDGVLHSSAGTYATEEREVVSELSAPNILHSPRMACSGRLQPSGFEACPEEGFPGKRKQPSHMEGEDLTKRKAVVVEAAIAAGAETDTELCSTTANQVANAPLLMLENKKLHAVCTEYEKRIEELQLKVVRLTWELQEANGEYERLLKDAIKNVGV